MGEVCIAGHYDSHLQRRRGKFMAGKAGKVFRKGVDILWVEDALRVSPAHQCFIAAVGEDKAGENVAERSRVSAL